MTERLLLLEEGVVRLSFTARIERPQFHRGGSASKKDGLTAPYPDRSGISPFLSGISPQLSPSTSINNHITFTIINNYFY
jgi:hypothetical protein